MFNGTWSCITCVIVIVVAASRGKSECPPGRFLEDFVWCNVIGSDNYPVITTRDGPVGGKCSHSVIAGRRVCSWKGIPFASPPIGDLRFMPPELPVPWKETLWSLDFGKPCLQIISVPFGAEDCLYLNVFLPKDQCTPSSPCPVMIYIFGGGFLIGSGDSTMLGTEHFMTEDVIVVTFNYRIGPFGFLNTEDTTIPGNAGLLDQLLVLKWVQNNIEHFGGDINSVTIFGESAGAASICYHCMASASAGLFHKVILQSGSCLAEREYVSNPRQILIKLAEEIGLNFTSIADLTAQLKKYDANKLNFKALQFVLKNLNTGSGSFAPSKDYLNPSFLSDKPRNLLRQISAANESVCHNADMINGMVLNEGGILRLYLLLNRTALEVIPNNKEELTPPKCNLQKGSPASIAVGQKVFDRYYSNGVDEWSYYQYHTGANFLDNEVEFYKAYIRSGKTPYIYSFNYCGLSNYVRDILFPLTSCKKIGPIHSDELYLEFTQSLLPTSGLFGFVGKVINGITQITKTPTERHVIKQFVKSFCNFARESNPTPGDLVDPVFKAKWTPVTNDRNIQVYNFGETVKMSPHPHAEELIFWENICNVD